MTVAYVLKRFPRLSQTFVINELLAHQSAGLPIRVFSLRRPKPEDSAADVHALTAPVHYLGERNARLDGRRQPTVEELAEELAQAISRLGLTHLHAHFGNSAAEVARLAARACGVGYTFTAHARDIFLDGIDHDALGLRLRQAKAVVTVSEFNREHLCSTYALARAQVTRIYNGLDLERFPCVASARKERLIFAVGRLIEKKGFGDLLQACAHLREHGVEFRCAIAGSGPLAGELAGRIEHLGLQDRVELLGAIAPGEVTRWMQRASVLAAPCVVGADGDRDGLPTVLLEAMASGCPCVSTDVTGIPEILRDSDTGLLAPQHDAPALAGALGRLLNHPGLGQTLARAARRQIERSFDIHRNAAHQRTLFSPRPGGVAAQAAALALELP
jgi:colanic acid/amylovoran biosynthesis glycosyltransferase